MKKKIFEWFEERLGIADSMKNLLDEPLPEGVGWTHVFGSVSLFLLILQAVTGIFLSMFYAPTPDAAYKSVSFIQEELSFGGYVRGLHHWGSSFFIVFVGIHLLRTFIYSAYKRPRELNWMFGVLLLMLVLAFGLTGYLLPWDQKAYWATVVSLNISGSLPIIGGFVQKVIQGGEVIGSVTLTHFYSLHVIILPLFILLLVSVHVALQKKQGVHPPFNKPGEPVRYTSRFFPDQVFKDGVAILVVFITLSFFAFRFGTPLEGVADPTDSSYVPRPEWYFLFLFQLLKYFQGPLELVGTFVIPSIAFAALLFLPLYDRNPSHMLRDRKVALTSMFFAVAVLGTLTLLGAADKGEDQPVQRTVELDGSGEVKIENFAPSELAGRYLFENESCIDCHSIEGTGGDKAPDLAETAHKKDAEWMIGHFKNPSAVVPGTSMPHVNLTEDQLSSLSAFILRLKSPEQKAMLEVPGNVLYGTKLFIDNKCGNCHPVAGMGAEFGPDLAGVAKRHDAEWILEHFEDPRKFDPKSYMPSFAHLPPEELRALTDYLLALD